VRSTRSPDSPSLSRALADGVVVLDGGLATALEARGHDLSSDLWSARLLLDGPDAVVEAHRDFFAAGAQVATTASYQVSVEGFAAQGLGPADTASALRRSVELAERARCAMPADRPRWVAASVGPYGAALADGSEYRGSYRCSVAELRAWHRPRLQVLMDTTADVLALETIPCLAEVEALLAEVDGTGAPCWLSLTCSGTTTRAGEPVEEAFAMAADVPEVVAVGVNCVDPGDVPGLVSRAASLSGKPAVAYPNSGETWDASERAWHGPPTFAASSVQEWTAAGARLVGGCCRVLPEAIAAIAAVAPGGAGVAAR
jgi:homocysteine S-methyltransferase